MTGINQNKIILQEYSNASYIETYRRCKWNIINLIDLMGVSIDQWNEFIAKNKPLRKMFLAEEDNILLAAEAHIKQGVYEGDLSAVRMYLRLRDLPTVINIQTNVANPINRSKIRKGLMRTYDT